MKMDLLLIILINSAALDAAVADDLNVPGTWQGHQSQENVFDDEADGD